MARTHRHQASLTWSGSTAVGYRDYDRNHRVALPPAPDLEVSADPAFRGDPQVHNPEQLLLAAASSCQLLSFLALAAQAGVVVDYRDEATAEMPATTDRMRITRITLSPRITLAPGSDVGPLAAMVVSAHEGCYVANSLSAEVVVAPTFVVQD